MGTLSEDLSEVPSVHNHRLNHSPSKLPSYRGTDLLSGTPLPLQGPLVAEPEPATPALEPQPTHNDSSEHAQVSVQHQHTRNQSDSATISPSRPSLPLARPLTFPGVPGFATSTLLASPISPPTVANPRKGVPAKHSRNDKLRDSRPPPSLQKYLPMTDNTSTSDWVAEQSTNTPPLSIPSNTSLEESPKDPAQPPQSKPPLTPLIPPIRAFRSSRRSLEMIATPRRSSMDQDSPDETSRAPEGCKDANMQRSSNREQEEQTSDDSDLFLKVAQEEALTNNYPARGLIRRSQVNRQSLPPSSAVFQSAISRRRGLDHESAAGLRRMDEPRTMSQALVYRMPARDREAPLEDMHRYRYNGATSRSTPTTPRALGSSEISPEFQVFYGGRKPSVPESVLPARTGSHRQAKVSHSNPRIYSSPLVSRTADIQETRETPRVADGTESTVSTTAPSTVWDELEDLKSRIHRLELTGKLPATSRAAMSRASNERPPTATTTVTTISSSPKRERGNSTSPTDSIETSPADAHPLLHAALAKSKSLLAPEVYKALETAAMDALAITAMMGTSGQPGPISSSQSTLGGPSGLVSDRQVRRKADSMCRSLTELCLALSEAKIETAPALNDQAAMRPSSRDNQTIIKAEFTKQRPSLSSDLTRTQSSPRALSRLEARRNSLLATNSVPSPRYAPSDVGTPTQSSMAGRRTSMLLRSRRGGTEEPEEEDEARFRAPSRANTDIGRLRNSPREYTSQQPMPDNRQSGLSSTLPRRHYMSTANMAAPPLSALPSLGSRRYQDRSTPERDTASVAGRLADDRAQRKSSIGQSFAMGRTESVLRRTKQPTGDAQGGMQHGGYQ